MVVAAEQSDREVEAFTCIIPTYLGSQIQAFGSMTSSTKSQATTKQIQEAQFRHSFKIVVWIEIVCHFVIKIRRRKTNAMRS
jgi:hypothetical protein